MPFDPKTLALYPDESGVYLMKDAKSVVLYVGKAKHLRTRLRQYFSKIHDTREQVPHLMAQVETIDTIVTLTEKDALILENNLIKQHRPKYNILLKDDKAFISLVITNHKWPMIRIFRFKEKPKQNIGTIFGPYTNALAARQTLDLISKLFPLRQCSDAEFATRKRPCLLYDLKKCIAPCVGKCSEEEYQSHVEAAKRLLKGQNQEVLKELKKKREAASDALEFEKAEEYHRFIKHIEHVTEIQHVENLDAEDTDVLGLAREKDALLISLLLFRNGRITGSEHFSFHSVLENDQEALETFLLQHYKTQTTWPKEILIPFELAEQSTLQELLSEAAHRPIALLTPQKGKKLSLIEMGHRNAKALLIREQDARSLKEKRLLDLQESLALTRYPRRIECFDTSNLFGTDAVASLASFVHGEKDKSRTRLFKIKGVETSDYPAMKQVLMRHFTREKEKGDFCDLLIVDGGKAHLTLALDVFKELGIASIDVIALAKEKGRHDKGLTQEKVFVPHRKDPILIDLTSATLFLLQKIRDEAHRQSLTFHQKRRSKRIFTSALDEIQGIGPMKKKKLLQHFGSVKAIAHASREELEKVKGLSKKDIDLLIKTLRPE